MNDLLHVPVPVLWTSCHSLMIFHAAAIDVLGGFGANCNYPTRASLVLGRCAFLALGILL